MVVRRTHCITEYRGKKPTAELVIEAVFLRNIQRYVNYTKSEDKLNRFESKINNENHQILFPCLSNNKASRLSSLTHNASCRLEQTLGTALVPSVVVNG